MRQVERLRKFRHQLMSEGYLPPEPESYKNKACAPSCLLPPPSSSDPYIVLPPCLPTTSPNLPSIRLFASFLSNSALLASSSQCSCSSLALNSLQHMKRVYDSMGIHKDELQWQLDLFARKGLKFKPDKKLRST